MAPVLSQKEGVFLYKIQIMTPSCQISKVIINLSHAFNVVRCYPFSSWDTVSRKQRVQRNCSLSLMEILSKAAGVSQINHLTPM